MEIYLKGKLVSLGTDIVLEVVHALENHVKYLNEAAIRQVNEPSRVRARVLDELASDIRKELRT